MKDIEAYLHNWVDYYGIEKVNNFIQGLELRLISALSLLINIW